jgi:Tfp pilus assembly protein PilF
MRPVTACLLGGLLLADLWFDCPHVAAQDAKAQAVRAEIKLDKGKLPLSGRPPAKLVPDLCLLRYRISTDSPQCQAFFEQGLAWFYSYVYPDAVRSFEMATLHDPECAMAWWGLSRALDSDNKPELAQQALDKARLQQNRASHREQFLITALLQSKTPVPRDSPPEQQRAATEKNRLAAIKTIDELLSLYDDDEEGWFLRAKLAGTGVAAVPFYKALARLNPLHPGATHELVHYYDSINRPALAWPYTENYIKGSPGIPHAYHMQVDHIALRLGRWDKVIEHAPRASEPELLLLALIHEGRFAEARKLGNRTPINRFLLHMAERQWQDARAVLDTLSKDDPHTFHYFSALYHLKQERPDLAAPFVDLLRQALQAPPDKKAKVDRNQLENRQLEAEGLLLCQQGDTEAGLALLAKLGERTKNAHRQMGWAHGAYFDEIRGLTALRNGKDEVAEEALQHALAHDSGSARGALGMQVLCERQGRDDEAKRFRDLAHRIWANADAGALDAELAYLRQTYAAQKKTETK